MSASTSPAQSMLLHLAVTGFLSLVLAASRFEPASAAASQAVLQGVVTDEISGEGIASATVTLLASGAQTRTTADGIFTFSALPHGRVSVRAQAAGYPAVVEEVEVGQDAVVFVQIRLPSVPMVLRELLVMAPRRMLPRITTLARRLISLPCSFPGSMRTRGSSAETTASCCPADRAASDSATSPRSSWTES